MDFTKVENDGELYSYDYTILAVISNVTSPPETPDYTVNLQTTDIDEKDFLQLFFNYSTNHFNINSANTFSKLISLKDKLFVSSANQLVSFNFNQLILSKLAEKYSKTDVSLTALKKITALKLSSQINSLAQVRGFQKALTWYETIDILISSNIISVSLNPLAIANVLLTVQFIFVEPSSNLSLAINYNFNVAIPGYTNVNNSPSDPITYSSDEIFSHSLIFQSSGKNDNDSFFTNNDDESFFPKNDTESFFSKNDDDESIDYSITNSIVQQIKLIQQTSSNVVESESINDNDYDESINYSITSSILKQIQLVQQSSASDCDTLSTNADVDSWS